MLCNHENTPFFVSDRRIAKNPARVPKALAKPLRDLRKAIQKKVGVGAWLHNTSGEEKKGLQKHLVCDMMKLRREAEKGRKETREQNRQRKASQPTA